MYSVKELEPKVARDYVKKYHYSGKVVANSKIHLGCFDDHGVLCGVLQYGPPMNGSKTSDKILKGVSMVELNRMVMRDEEPRNSESMAISACNKWLRKNTDIKYLLSFSDGKEGNVGYIYQATNWKYIGYLLSDSFYKLDDAVVHAVTVWHKFKEKHKDRDTKTTNEILCDNFEYVSKITCKQHIYLLALDKRVKFPFNEVPYPKVDKEIPVLREVVYKDKQGVYLPKGKPVVFSNEELKSVF